jgi:ribonuclease HII
LDGFVYLSENNIMEISLRHEYNLWQKGYKLVAGMDEVGRGSWAGPIVAGAVIIDRKKLSQFKKQSWFKQVADSKLLTPLKRESIFKACEKEIIWAVGVVNNRVIDRIGIGEANRRVIHLAINNLPLKPNYILVDYVSKLGDKIFDIPAEVLVDGDAKVFSIALASIIAKVYRDRLMTKYHAKYSGYGFKQHKGYGTAQHASALKKLGPSSLHRHSYRPVSACLV